MTYFFLKEKVGKKNFNSLTKKVVRVKLPPGDENKKGLRKSRQKEL